MYKVTVIGDPQGNVINISENPEYGFIRLKQESVNIARGGWLKIEKRHALLHGKVDDLIKINYSIGQQLPGKIVVKESLVPFNDKNPDRDLKVAGKTGIILRVDDQPIYRQTFYTLDETERDELIQHDTECRNEIKDVLAAQRLVEDMKIMNEATL